jgi:hypothetical protein
MRKTPDMCSVSTSSAEAFIDERLVIVLFADDGWRASASAWTACS